MSLSSKKQKENRQCASPCAFRVTKLKPNTLGHEDPVMLHYGPANEVLAMMSCEFGMFKLRIQKCKNLRTFMQVNITFNVSFVLLTSYLF